MKHDLEALKRLDLHWDEVWQTLDEIVKTAGEVAPMFLHSAVTMRQVGLVPIGDALDALGKQIQRLGTLAVLPDDLRRSGK